MSAATARARTRLSGEGAGYKLVGDTIFGWRTGTLTGDIDLNGHALVMETGGGNRTVFSGAITGRGSLEWRGGGVPQVAPSILGGDKPNTFQGAFTLAQGVLDLDKPAGVDAIPGDLVIGAKASALVKLDKPNQINDAANVTLGGHGHQRAGPPGSRREVRLAHAGNPRRDHHGRQAGVAGGGRQQRAAPGTWPRR